MHHNGRVAVIDGDPSTGEWGVSVDVAEGEEFTGHSDVRSSAKEAVRAAWALLSR
jgi:hypothetical protein